jgi:chorismate dehydratase
LDPTSKTSQRLLKVLLVKKYQRNLEEIHWVEQPEAADTVLGIGDKALTMSHYGNSTDLGSDWTQFTGLPFVYACWMTKSDITQELLTHLHNAKMLGKQSLEAIAARQRVVDPDDAFSYLTNNIQYDIEGPELVGLRIFFDWVVELENQNYDTSFRFVA